MSNEYVWYLDNMVKEMKQLTLLKFEQIDNRLKQLSSFQCETSNSSKDALDATAKAIEELEERVGILDKAVAKDHGKRLRLLEKFIRENVRNTDSLQAAVNKELIRKQDEWIRKMADAEDAAGSVSVGGLAADTNQPLPEPDRVQGTGASPPLGTTTAKRREWWVYRHRVKGHVVALNAKGVHFDSDWEEIRVIAAPSEEEIEEAVEAALAACEKYRLIEDVVRAAIRKLLGGEK